MGHAANGPATQSTEDQQRQARIDLAAAYRLVELSGWGEGIFNHISMRVPSAADEFYIKRFDITYGEVTASNLLRVPIGADLDERAGVNRPGYVLHSGILQARADVNCVLHMHTVPIVAVSVLERGLRMFSQNAALFHGQIGYHAFEGITDGLAEQPRIVAALGRGSALFLRAHGGVTVGRSPARAFTAMGHLFEACRIQLALEALGGAVPEIPESICRRTAEQFAGHDTGRGTAEWPALLRRLDGCDPSYRF
jgi:ribulose-5-phosphate 4-epimerase/fuculose-1-phosphate aldolase